MKIKLLLFLGYFCLMGNLLHAQNFAVINPGDSEQEIIKKAAGVIPSDRQLQWQERELSAFFHFGINTFTNKEWGDGKEDPKLFNPTNFNAEQWVRIVKNAGFKQVILTAKHHDGFCLWPSKFTEHSVKNSPWRNGKGDVVKEVAAACHRLGIGFGVYLSPWDRNIPLYGTGARYDQYFRDQLAELLTNYGNVDEVWFDGANGEGSNGKKQIYDFDSYYRLIRKLQPKAVIAVMGPDVRWVGTETGYGRDTEWSVLPADPNMLAKIADGSQKEVVYAPAGNKMAEDLGSRAKLKDAKALVWYPAETDVSIRPGWFYHPEEDNKVKTPEKLLDIYINSVGKNSVLLLNIPPDKNGLISKADSAALMGFAALKKQAFKNNLLNKAKLNPGFVTIHTPVHNDVKRDYYTSTDSVLVLEYTLSTQETINALQLSENLAYGQRTEKFILEYLQNDQWLKATEGTTIGYKRILKFKPIATNKVKITITGRANPVIKQVGLYEF